MSCHSHDRLDPNSLRLEASKKVLLVHVPQWAAKLQAVKVLVSQKIKSVHRWRCFHMKTLQPLKANGQVVPFWKSPISHYFEPGSHGGGRTFRAQNP